MKKSITYVLLLALLISLCYCIFKNQAEIRTTEEKTEYYTMQIQLLESLQDLLDADRIILQSLNAFTEGDFESAKSERIEAIKEISETGEKIEDVISSPNLIQIQIEKLQEENERVLKILEKGNNISEDEYMELMLLEIKSCETLEFLIFGIQAFSYLYSIRAFDQLPDEQAHKELASTWWEFGFDESIECPQKIDEKELYLIWANQFSEDFVETENFLNDLQRLREKDKLTSKKINQEWEDFMQNYIFSTKTGTTNVVPNIFL